jgi:hypothetical protein
MYEWVINYENAEALQEIKKTGIILFEPEFDDLKFIIMKTYLSKETIMKIKGVTECREPMIGSVYV